MADKEKQGNWFGRHKILTGILGIFVFFVLIAAVSGGDKSNTDKTSNSDTTKTEQPAAEAKQPEAKPDIPAEYKSALSKGDSYANTMHMSKQGVYDQLTSEYGEKFTVPAAQYAIDNVKADWNANALAKAKDYQSQQSMSPKAIHSQLVSAYGEKFTKTEADYAIAHLND